MCLPGDVDQRHAIVSSRNISAERHFLGGGSLCSSLSANYRVSFAGWLVKDAVSSRGSRGRILLDLSHPVIS